MDKNNTTQSNLTDQVMRQIHHDQIQIRPRIYFLAGTVLFGLGLTSLFLLTIFTTNLIAFRLRTFGHMGYLRYGTKSFPILIDTLPWEPIVFTIATLVLGSYLLHRFSQAYRYRLTMIIGITLISLGTTGFIIDQVGINSMLEHHPMLETLYQKKSSGPRWLIGRITEINDQSLTLLIKDEKIVTVTWDRPLDQKLETDQEIRLIGEWDKDGRTFNAKILATEGFPTIFPPRSKVKGQRLPIPLHR